MASVLYDNIGELVTNDPTHGGASLLGLRRDAAVVVEDGVVAWVGAAGGASPADERVDLLGRCVLPAFVDGHTHLVFDGDRAQEFAARMAGEPYAAGGIRTTVAATRAASAEALLASATTRLDEARRQGTGLVEVKSGYGLDVETEVKMLQVARQLTDETTFLGAHVVPAEWQHDPDGYVGLVCGEMLDACAPLVRWIDVFVEDGAFGAEAARAILRAGQAAGLGLRVHANQLRPGPGVRLACELGAASADHCTHLTDADVQALADSGTVATLVPGADFSTRSPVYPDGRKLWDAGATVALATDCNPGTSYTTSMPFVIALAVRECHLTPSEAVWAATAGAARSLRRDDVGRVAVGDAAALTVVDAPTHLHLAYRPAVPLTRVLAATTP
ncbi:imidazolonepropionase [Egicoccus halophilus]|uniref:Imidazolonepropionase n=1 Tax=Egicoccus halophilus TaxID=1670830 RepID=A0A8J3A8X9_9ACTN|nr:imidazolonepropionase [Egicoccus halophilus]GGI07107.1 imidazolonepropionase [Egicoccus halophilus]